MRLSWMLQVCVLLLLLLLGLGRSLEEETGRVPRAQLRMLSLGLAHLLRGLEENGGQLERQGRRAEAELEAVSRSTKSLQRRNAKTERTHRQVRREEQAQAARLRRTLRELQEPLDHLERDRRSLQHRLDLVLRRICSRTEPRSRGHGRLNVSNMQVVLNKQTRRLRSLTSVLSAQDQLMDRRRHRIQHLEKHVRNLRASGSVPAARRTDSDCV